MGIAPISALFHLQYFQPSNFSQQATIFPGQIIKRPYQILNSICIINYFSLQEFKQG